MLFEFSMVFMFLAIGAGFVLLALGLGALIRPRRMVKARNETYECGELPTGQGWYNFNPRFYMLALIFLIFDVELVVTYPVITVMRQWAEQGRGWLAFVEVLLFIAILVAGFAFLWNRGDLEWLKKIEGPEQEGSRT